MRGENLACKFLKKSKYKILARNYRCPAGEADIIALDTKLDQLVFVEVKTRSSDYHIAPESAVDHKKQNRLRNIARYYPTQRETNDLTIRFDVISVIISALHKPTINHIVDAFC